MDILAIQPFITTNIQYFPKAETAKTEISPDEVLELVRQAQKENTDAYNKLIQLYEHRIYYTIFNMLSNHEDTNDILQETFIKGYQGIKSFKGDSTFHTWLHRIAINKTLNFIKKRKQRNHISLNTIEEDGLEFSKYADLLMTNTQPQNFPDVKHKLNIAMQKLSFKHRLVVTLFDIEELSHEEISKITKTNVGTVRSRLHYAHQQLQAELKDILKQIINQ